MTQLALALTMGAVQKPAPLALRALAAVKRAGGTVLAAGAATPVLGAELVTNGDFSNGTTGWTCGNTGTQTIESGALRVAGDGMTTWSGISETTIPALTKGKQYLVQFSVLAENTSSGAGLYFRTASLSIGGIFTNGLDYFYPSAVGNYSILLTATVDNINQLRIVAGNESNASVLFDNISVKEILGYTYGNPPTRNYFDSAGTDILDSVTQVDQPVGLVLDAAGTVGPNTWLDANAGFNGESSRVSAGVYRIYSSAGSASNVVDVVSPLVTGKSYEVQYTIDSVTTVGGGVRVCDTGVVRTTTGRASEVFVATGASFFIKRAAGATDIQISNISVKEIPGNHATQPTTGSKPTLRRGLVNQLTQSDFANGLTDAPVRGGPVTASTLSGYGGAIAFGHDGVTDPYAYKTLTPTSGVTYTFGCVVKMDDGNAPAFGSSTNFSALNSFCLNGSSTVINPTTYTSVALGDGFYFVCTSFVAGAGTAFGVIKYATQTRTFKVTRYGLFNGTVTAQQILAAGGIPLTTTAPASSALGNYWWQFDPAAPGDFLQTSITTGNEGWVCAGVTPSVLKHAGLISNGGAANTNVGARLMLRSNGDVWLNTSNGTSLSNATAIGAYAAGVAKVIDGGWKVGQNVFVAVNGVEVSGAATVNPTSTTGLYVGCNFDSSVGDHLNGAMPVAVICPTLPPSADRALIRAWVAKQQGQVL